MIGSARGSSRAVALTAGIGGRLVWTLPFGLVAYGLTIIVQAPIEQALIKAVGGAPAGLVFPIVSGPIFGLAVGVCMAATLAVTRKLPPSLLRHAPRLFSAVVASIMAGLVIKFVSSSAGLVLCLIPGLFLASRYLVVVPALLCEDIGLLDAMDRSAWLTDGSRLKSIGLAIGMVILVSAPMWLYFIPGYGRFLLGLPHPLAILLFVTMGALGIGISAALILSAYEALATGDTAARHRVTAFGDPETWRPSILASLQRDGVRPAREASLAHWYLRTAAGWAAIFAIFLSPLLLIAASAIFSGAPEIAGWALLLALPWTIVSSLWALALAFRHGRQVLIDRRGFNPVIEVKRAHGPPLLYLRSFPFDDKAARVSISRIIWSTTLGLIGAGGVAPTPEMAMVRALPRKVPVLAIGKPGESRPPPGALRFYVDHDKWQQQIALMVPNCQLVVWVTGYTPGLKWELDFLRSNLQPHQLILWTHMSLERLSKAKRRAEWQAFVDTYGATFPKGLPEGGERFRFVVFMADWTPVGVHSPSFPILLHERFHLGNGPIGGLRSVLKQRLA